MKITIWHFPTSTQWRRFSWFFFFYRIVLLHN
uniref:Uncharacterized protein n=1 Tax=Rhizophora mucronata TaxID=61149 RepID=A0A2P2P3Z7_RHIMU